MPIRILFLVDQLSRAGAQLRAFNLARSLDPDRFEVQFVCLFTHEQLREEIEAAGFSVTMLAFHHNPLKLRNVRQMWKLTRLVRSRVPTIVHTFTYWASIVGSFASRRASVPIVITSRTCEYKLKPQGRVFQLLERYSNPIATSVTTISEAVSQDTVRYEGIPEDKITMIYNGVKLGRPSTRDDDMEFWQSLGLLPGDSVGVMIANFHEYKRHDTLVRAAQSVLEQRPETKFLLVGTEREGVADDVKRLAQDLGVADSIHFTGVRSDIRDILGVCDVGILCSETEALSNVLLEYMEAGLPVIATRTGGIPEVVEHGTTGWLVPVGDDKAIAGHLVDLLADPQRASEMGAAGRERVHDLFDHDRMVERYTLLYESLLVREGVT